LRENPNSIKWDMGRKNTQKNYHISTKPEMGKEKLTSKRRAMAGDNSMEGQGF
jgi:hypothetical protein